MEEVLKLKYIEDGEEKESKFGIADGNLVLIKDEPPQSDNAQAEDVGQSEEKENAPVVPPQPVVVKDSSLTIIKQKETKFTAQANTLYSFEDAIDSLTVKLAKPTDEDKTAEYVFAFVTEKDFKFNEFDTEDGYPVFYPTDFVLNNSTIYVLSVMYIGGGYAVNAIPYL